MMYLNLNSCFKYILRFLAQQEVHSFGATAGRATGSTETLTLFLITTEEKILDIVIVTF